MSSGDLEKQSWNSALVLEYQKKIKDQLDEVSDEKDPSKRLRFALKCLKDLEEDSSDVGLLRRYIYGMSALVHYERYGGLRIHQVNGIYEIIFKILQLQQMNPYKSRLRFLFEDFYLVKSQICRKHGDQWNSAWEQQMSRRYLIEDIPEEVVRQHLADGIRALRLGNCKIAAQNFILAERAGSGSAQFVRARLGRIQAYRLSGSLDLCESLLNETLENEQLGDNEKLDLEWEKVCLNVKKQQDLSEMTQIVSTKGSHYLSSYFLEAYLWVKSVAEKKWESQIAMVRSMARPRSLNVNKAGFFYKCSIAIENAYDAAIPFEIRLNTISEALSQKGSLMNIEKELLFMAAVSRWLARNRAFPLARLTLSEYQAICHRMSEGTNRDVLGIMEDLLSKPWYSSFSEE